MKLVNSAAVAETNVSTSHKFGIENLNIVMSMLSKLYTYPIRTLTQEYICNGRDANRESNSIKPLEITAPSTFAPELIVRDYGLGLSEERIKTVFLLYGASTKRTTNGQTGGFGIGAKSAWAYTDSFTVTSYCEGLKTVYVCHKTNDGGHMDILEQTQSNEPSGVEIRIPVNNRDIGDFHGAITRCCFFWDKNERPKCNIDLKYFNGEKVSDNFTVNTNNMPHCIGNYSDLAVIDGIPYPCNFLEKCGEKKIDDLLTANSKIFFLDNGKVEISPSREEIVESDKSRAALTILIDKESVKLKTYISGLFKDCKTDLQRLKVVGDYQGKYKLDTLTNGYTYGKLFGEKSTRYTRSNPFGYTNNTKDFNGNSFTICNIDDGKVTKKSYNGFNVNFDIYYNDTEESAVTLNKRLRNSGLTSVVIANVDDIVNFDNYKTQLEIKPISSLALPAKAPKGTKRVDSSTICLHYYRSYRTRPKHVKVSEIDDLYYAEMNDNATHNQRNIILQNGHTFCAVSKTSLKKLQSSPKAKHYSEFFKTYKVCDKMIHSVIVSSFEDCELKSWVIYGLEVDGVKFLDRTKSTFDYFTDEIKETVKNTKEYKATEKQYKINTEILSKLPLLKTISAYEYKTNSAAIDEYINWKLK